MDTLSIIFSALSDPTRRAILAHLARGAATVGEIAEPFDMSGPAISKHLQVLEHAGLVQPGRDGQSRPRTLDAAPLREVVEWAEEFLRFRNAADSRPDPYLEQINRGED